MSSSSSAAQQQTLPPLTFGRLHTILLVESDLRLQHFWEKALTDGGFQVVIAATPEEAVRHSVHGQPNLVFLGTGLDGNKAVSLLETLRRSSPDLSVLAPANLEQVRRELDAMENHGAVTPESLLVVNQVKIAVTNAVNLERLSLEKRTRDDQNFQMPQFRELVGSSSQTQALRRAIAEAIQADPATVLILGETGTGKAVVAHAIHSYGIRQNKPFVVVECTAMPAALLESELFGYEAGAFTDARVSKKGLLEVAEGGTIFLDEIGELELPVQAKLLRVLEDKRARRLGGTQDYAANVRFIAATNRPLESLVREGRFRQDLYFRLNVFHIPITPLRERKEDMVCLAVHFVQQFTHAFHKQIHGLSFAAQEQLAAYHWPGNVRELRNIIERAVILEQGQLISPRHLALGAAPSSAADSIRLPEGGLALEEVEKTLVNQALEKACGNQTEAAKLLKITRFALRTRMKKFGLL